MMVELLLCLVCQINQAPEVQQRLQILEAVRELRETAKSMRQTAQSFKKLRDFAGDLSITVKEINVTVEVARWCMIGVCCPLALFIVSCLIQRWRS